MNRPMGGRRSEGGVQWIKALVLIVVLVLVGILILYKTGSSSSGNASGSHRTTTTPSSVSTVPAPVTTTTVLPASEVKVQVLNGLRTGSLASQWNTKLKHFGYITELPDDATVRTTTSIIYIITPGYQAEANQLAAQVGLASTAVDPTVPAPASAPIPATERSAANLVLVIGQDLAGTA